VTASDSPLRAGHAWTLRHPVSAICLLQPQAIVNTLDTPSLDNLDGSAGWPRGRTRTFNSGA
jgi:hypothetical protein